VSFVINWQITEITTRVGSNEKITLTYTTQNVCVITQSEDLAERE